MSAGLSTIDVAPVSQPEEELARPIARRQPGWVDGAIWAALAGSLGVFYLAPGAPLIALGALGFATLCAWRPRYGLVFGLLTAPFYRFPRELGEVALPLSEAAIWLGLIGWLGRLAIDRSAAGGRGLVDRTAWRDPFGPYWPAVGFLAVATLSLGASEFLRYSLREYRLVIVEPLLYYFVLTAVYRTERDAAILMRALIGVGAVVATIGVVHYLVSGVTEATGGVQRALAIYHSPNALGLFLGRIAPAALVLALLGRGLGRERLAAAGAAAIILAGLFLTYSRGAWLGVAAALLFVAAWRGRRAVALAVGSLLATGAALVPLVGWSRLASQASSSQRLYLWEAAVDMVRDHPWQGVGLDNFLYQYPRYMRPEAWPEPHISHPHNLVLDFWLRLGVLGLVALVWLQISFWRAGARAYRRLAGRPSQVLVLATLAGMIDFLAHGLIDNSYFLIDLATIFWVSFALIHCLARSPDEPLKGRLTRAPLPP